MTAGDASGKGHTGTIADASWTNTSRYGKALSFNGTTSYVDLGDSPNLRISGSMTWSAWIFATANPPDDGQIIAKSSGVGWQFKTSPDTGPQTFAIAVSGDGSSLTQRYSQTVRQLDTWYYVAGVYDAAALTLDIYVSGVRDNGALVGTVPASQFDSPENVTIGRRAGGYNFAGIIDELRLYSRALSQAEIQSDMNSPVGATDTRPPTPPTGLVASSAGAGQIDLSWANTSSTQTAVKIERSTGTEAFTQIAVAGASAVRYSDSGLSDSTTYSYRLRAANSFGDSAYSNTATATTTTQPPSQVRPTLVQSLSTSSNMNMEAGNDFIVNLPNPVLANNCLILDLTYDYSPNRTVSVTDDKFNAWTAGPKVDDATNANSTQVFYAAGAAAGTQTLSIHFDNPTLNVHATVSEWYNIAIAAAANGSVGAIGVIGPTIAAGSFTPGNNDASGGNLIHHHAIAAVGSLGNLGSDITAVIPGSGFTLQAAQRSLAAVTQNFVQPSAAPINPTITVAQSVNDNYNTIAIAFKAANAGTAPGRGIRIVHMQHQLYGNAGTRTASFPATGNLVVMSAAVAANQNAINAVSDNKGNTWTRSTAGVASPQLFYASNATTGTDMSVNVTVANGNGLVIILWDIAGAATSPFDSEVQANGAQSGAGDDIVNAPLIRPATANGLVIAVINEYTGPPSSMIGAGQVADHIFYAGETDASLMDFGDGTAHIFNADASPIAFGWRQTNHPPTSGWTAIAVAFKAE
jgi:hypothetical protein